jgi:hypothetical protein
VVLEGVLRDLLPADIARRASGRVHVAVTQLAPGWARNPFRPLSGQLISDFEDKDDFIAALLASCYIPFYFDQTRPGVKFRGAWCADGGLTQFLPVPPRCGRAVRVTCFPAYSASRGYIDIAPDAPGPAGAATTGPYSVARLLQWALTPASDEVMNALVHQGRADAQRWVQRALVAPQGGAAAAPAEEEQAPPR